MRVSWRAITAVIPFLAALSIAVPPSCADPSGPTRYGGNIPEGVWVLNQERSRKFIPGSHVLWIVQDDGHKLAWVSVEKDLEGNVRITSWNGLYNGGPFEVKGSGMMSEITSPEKGQMLNHGDIPGLGSYAEDCQVMDEGKRMRCEFILTTEDGTKTYIDDFDWVSEGPLVFLSRDEGQ